MKITPIEIRQKEFEKAFRGYEKDEVDAFLTSLSQEWEKMIDENKELKRRLESSEKEVGKLREVEHSLYKALKTAEDTGSNMIEQANKSAELHLREAHLKAEAILNDAKSRARNLLEDAEDKARDIIEQLQDEINMVERDYSFLENQRDNFLGEMKSLANDLLEKISRNQGRGSRQDVLNKFRELKNMNIERKLQLSSDMDHSAHEVEQESKLDKENKPKAEPQQKTSPVQENKSKPGSASDEQGSFFDKL
ncbi:DivIVA domain-containing protein [Cytophagaceae bacterium ABcell3]|nr:DivIVA domain-containing protein [Cytophagaceae bacterium ABcell3]